MGVQDGVDNLVRALDILVNDLGRKDVLCVLIGGKGDALPKLKSLVDQLHLEEHVWFTGFIPDADVMRYLSTADICLDPNPSSPLNDVSTWIKVMEYMALGKPVVSFDLKETRTSAGEAAAYVPPNDEAAFAKAVAALMDDADRRRKMGAIGRQRVDEKLSWNITSRNLLSAYGQLLRTTFPAANAQALPPESSSRTAGA